MIAVIAEAWRKEKSYEGIGLSVAVQAVEKGASVALLGAVSQDEDGRALLEYLVDHLVMFDPDLAQNPLPSCEAYASLSKEGLLHALEANSDVRLAYVGGKVLCGKSGEQALEVLRSYEPNPVVMLEPAGECGDSARLLSLLSGADLVRLTGKELSLLSPTMEIAKAGALLGVHDLWLTLEGKQVWWDKEGWTVEVPFGPGQESGAVAAFLHDHGCFGHDGGEPEYRVTPQEVRQALGAGLAT